MKTYTALTENPCTICEQPIVGGVFIGDGDGNMTNGGRFAHAHCYRLRQQIQELENENTELLDERRYLRDRYVDKQAE